MAAPLSLHHYNRPFLSSDDTSPKNPPAVPATDRPHPCLISLEKCSNMSKLKQIHAQMLRTGLFFNPFEASKIVAFCSLQDSGSLYYARLVFSQIPNPTPYTFNSIIRGFTNNNFHHEALSFYREIIIQGLMPDRFTYPSLFKSCADISEGKLLHCHSTKFGFASDSYIQNSLMNMYSNCGCLVSTQVFDKMPEKTIVSWAAIIGAYSQWNQPNEALKLFERMENENVKPNEHFSE